MEFVCLEFGVCFGVCLFGVCLFGVWSLESVSLIERFPKLVGVQVSAGAGVGAGCPQFSGFHRDLLTVHFSPALLTRPEIQV